MSDWEQTRDRLERRCAQVADGEYVQLHADIRAALERVERPLDVEHTTSCGHTWTMRHTACPECFAALRQRVEELERERDEAKIALHLSETAEWMAKQRAEAAEAKLARCVEAFDRAEGGRGCFSCVEAHDCRCDLDRKISEFCTCGRVELDAAFEAARGE